MQIGTFNEKDATRTIIKELEMLKVKYSKLKEKEDQNALLANTIDRVCDEYEKKNYKISQEADNAITRYQENIVEITNSIKNVLLDIQKEKIDILKDFSPIIANYSIKTEGEYNFIKRPTIKEINEEKIKEILISPFNKKKVNNLEKVYFKNMKEFADSLNKNSKSDDTKAEKCYLDAVEKYIDDNILNENLVINYQKEDVENSNSQGKNAVIYLDIIANEKTKKLYISDQPDDDISHVKLNKEVINIFRKMKNNKQIILVTHKPELVVNLDVDNVVVFKEEKGEIIIKSGALEYEDKETNILSDVANILDGGEEVIRKRWKRYDK